MNTSIDIKMTCRLFSQNCRGLANKDKRNETMHWLANHVKGPFHIIMLQETHSCLKDEMGLLHG